MADRIKKIQENLKRGSNNGDELTAAVSYVPLIGWALTIKSKDDFTQFHAEQGRDLNIGIIAIFLVTWFLENFPLTSWLFGNNHLFHPVTQTVWLISLLAYLGLSAMAAYKAIMDERWPIPFIDEARDKIKQLLKKDK